MQGSRQLEEAEAFLAAYPLEAVRQAIAQTLERMRQDVCLFERLWPAIAEWLGGVSGRAPFSS